MNTLKNANISKRVITDAFAQAGIKEAAARNANCYNLIRQGGVAAAVGSIMAGAAREKINVAQVTVMRALKSAGVDQNTTDMHGWYL